MSIAALIGSIRHLLTIVALLLIGVGAAQSAMAQSASAADVANAIRNSPNASSWLRTNADAVGNLAMFESGGRLSIYNGSCCYGVLQMNTWNIRRYAGVEPDVFRTWSLQDQVNAWSRLTSDAMQSQVVRSLIALGTFDGRSVDGHLVLACVQLGIGNCQRMINSGRCSGFADSNGTTICAMADRIAGGGAGTPVTNPGGGHGTGPVWGGTRPDLGCVRGEAGGCMSMSEAMSAGFEAGAGVSMSRIRSVIQMLLAAITLLVIGGAMLGVWRQYAAGAIAKADLVLYTQRGLVIVMMVFVVMTIL